MDPDRAWVMPLAEAADCEENLIGGKAAKLARLLEAGFRVMPGACVAVGAYEQFLEETGLDRVIGMELGRKPLDAMRWEEIWDAALRIRSAFLAARIPARVSEAILKALRDLGRDTPLAVRSSAPGEDSANRSFAGLHESFPGVVGEQAALDAVRLVWASLWSDAALLYRRELSLDPSTSRMAVLIQVMQPSGPSGVAFGRDPRQQHAARAVIEAVPGPCSDLVDGRVDPDRWILDPASGEVLHRRRGDRDGGPGSPLLDREDLVALLETLQRVERLFGWPPDVEWTGRADRLTVLQARPITTVASDPQDQRNWYLTLRPGRQRLKELSTRVAEELIPQLQAEGAQLAAEDVGQYDDERLSAAIVGRQEAVNRWQKLYRDEFIPFAHGVRRLATYYNDAVRPDDPYEFVGLLRGDQMLASRRNHALERLARRARDNQALISALGQACSRDLSRNQDEWSRALQDLRHVPGGEPFVHDLEALLNDFMDVTYQGQRLVDRPDLCLQAVLELAQSQVSGRERGPRSAAATAAELERRLIEAVGPERHDEAAEVIQLARLSWRLRDDDNLLVARIESQLLRALQVGANRLRAAGRLERDVEPRPEHAGAIVEALRNPGGGPIELRGEDKSPAATASGSTSEKPRQLVGQPAAPGIETGPARRIVRVEDLGRFRAGEVLVCDAIQPMMTHLVPLARAIVERRGGMLIHGAIIARELGIPCVNGIANAVDLLEDEEFVTVDGYLGIVTVGPPEFDLELQAAAGNGADSRGAQMGPPPLVRTRAT